MSFFTKSISSRLLFWLTFLVGCVLIGFGVTAYQLHRTNRLNQIHDELESRLAALSADFRGRAGGGPPRGLRSDRPPPGLREPTIAELPTNPPLPFRMGEGALSPGEPPPGPRDRRQSDTGLHKPELLAQTLALFDEADTNAFYF